MFWFKTSRTLEAAAWLFFWGALAFFVVGTLGAAIAFAPWLIKVLAFLLLGSCALGAASAICDSQWKGC